MLLSIFFFFIIVLVKIASASEGDRNEFFYVCNEQCKDQKCSVDHIKEFHQSFLLRLFSWGCEDECRYDCMWLTVEFYEQNQTATPQFYGKWPFIRVFGIQEPMSVLASIINFAANLFMLKRIRKEISNRSPLKSIWLCYAYLNLTAWFWSAVFHTRDFKFSEKMDYYCAFGLILFQIYAFFIRLVTYNNIFNSSEDDKKLIGAIFLLVFFMHVGYLQFVKFDYGLNMKVNVLYGTLNSVCWIMCSIYEYKHKNVTYVWRAIATVLLLDVTTIIFEVYDFRPVLWLADAHSFWHLSTAIVPFISAQYFIDDATYYIKRKSLLT